MEKVTQNGEIIEIYKLHAEFVDRVSQRREGANRLYAGLLTSLVVILGAMFRLAPSNELNCLVFLVGGIIGAILSVSWYIVIRSYRQLNTGKFKALHELEKQLSYPFFTREWELLKSGRDYRRYWKLTVVETILPATLFLASIFFMVLYWIV